MSAYACTEDQLVEQPAIGLFAALGWTTVSALEETFGATGTLLRETKGEVVLVFRLRATLVMLNSALLPAAFTAAADQGNRKDSHGFVTLIPPLQKRFQEIAGAMLAQLRIFELPIQNRRQTRDLLLPRLLSGQIAAVTNKQFNGDD